MHVNDQIGKLETVRDRLQERVDRNLKRDPLVAAKMQQKLDVAQAQLQALSRKGAPEVLLCAASHARELAWALPHMQLHRAKPCGFIAREKGPIIVGGRIEQAPVLSPELSTIHRGWSR